MNSENRDEENKESPEEDEPESRKIKEIAKWAGAIGLCALVAGGVSWGIGASPHSIYCSACAGGCATGVIYPIYSAYRSYRARNR